MASTVHFSEEEMAELREAFGKVGEYSRSVKCFSHVLASREEREPTPVLICCVTKTTESPFPATAGLLDETTSARCRAMASDWGEMAGQ